MTPRRAAQEKNGASSPQSNRSNADMDFTTGSTNLTLHAPSTFKAMKLSSVRPSIMRSLPTKKAAIKEAEESDESEK